MAKAISLTLSMVNTALNVVHVRLRVLFNLNFALFRTMEVSENASQQDPLNTPINVIIIIKKNKILRSKQQKVSRSHARFHRHQSDIFRE